MCWCIGPQGPLILQDANAKPMKPRIEKRLKYLLQMMSTSSLPFPVTVEHHRHRRPPPLRQNCLATTENRSISFCSPSWFVIDVHRSFPFFNRNSRFGLCCATSSPTEPPPPPEPPSVNKLPPSSGVSPKDTLQVFFAVLFWMSLFFWSCVWDGGNSGRPDKGSRFRK